MGEGEPLAVRVEPCEGRMWGGGGAEVCGKCRGVEYVRCGRLLRSWVGVCIPLGEMLLVGWSCGAGGGLLPVGVCGRAWTVGVVLVECTVVNILTHF